MSAFPLDPRLSRVIVSSAYLGCLVEVLSILSMLYVSPVFYVPMAKRDEFGEIQQQFYHPDGDLISLLLIYRAYVRSSRTNDQILHPIGSRSNSRQTWCRAHFLNRSRLETAIKVRGQLKQIVRGSALARSGFRSCGADLYKITQAFLQSGFHDQVALLADSALLTISGIRALSEFSQSRRSVYTLAGLNQPGSGRFFLIHPESQLYLASLSDTPPGAVLFIETVTQSTTATSEKPPTCETVQSPILTYMRHVATVQWGSTSHTDSNSRVEFNNWLTILLSEKSTPNRSGKRSRDLQPCDHEVGQKRSRPRDNASTFNVTSCKDVSQTILNHIEAVSSPSLKPEDSCHQAGNSILTKRQRKRLAAKRKKQSLLSV
ncbi:unnamed protein product [Echinostoma caproni]|uniref:RNA helicase n=1 Tax=Echinostoma caproni TaxID=27848 RepID=A0A183AZ39_9TREM|nr:unnamed protein product [Echinostoma caproni]